MRFQKVTVKKHYHQWNRTKQVAIPATMDATGYAAGQLAAVKNPFGPRGWEIIHIPTGALFAYADSERKARAAILRLLASDVDWNFTQPMSRETSVKLHALKAALVADGLVY